MNYLVAGGAGFIGSHLVDRLAQLNSLRGGGCNSITVVDNLRLGKTAFIEKHFGDPDFKFYNVDAADEEALDKIFSDHKFDRVYHLAANSDIQKSAKDPNIDVHDTLGTTLSILLSMRKHGVKELFFASTSAIYGNKTELLKEDTGDLKPISYYGAAKLSSEAFISAFAAMCDLKVNIIRFANVIGGRLTHGVIHDFIKKLRRNPKQLEILGDGNQEKPYIYVEDLIEAILFLPFDHEGVNVFNAGVTTATKVKRIADMICEQMHLPAVEYKFTGGSVGWKGDVAKFQYDLSKIHEAGWSAKHTSDEAIGIAIQSALREAV